MVRDSSALRRSQQTQSLLVLGAIGGLAALTRLRDPHVSGAAGECPFLALTGLYCPGCGSLRALRDLTDGDLAGALSHNVLAVAMLAVLVVWAARLWLAGDAGPRPLTAGDPGLPSRARTALLLRIPASWVVLVLVSGFWLARNLPDSPLAPT